VFSARVIDSTPPSSWIRGVYNSASYETDDYTPLNMTAAVPQDSSVNIWVRIEDNDRDAKDRLTTLLPNKSTSAGLGGIRTPTPTPRCGPQVSTERPATPPSTTMPMAHGG